MVEPQKTESQNGPTTSAPGTEPVLVAASLLSSNIPVDQLLLPPGLQQNLIRAGISTVGQLEQALKDEQALQTKVYRCGAKAIQLLRDAVAQNRERDAGSHHVPITPTPSDGHSASATPTTATEMPQAQRQPRRFGTGAALGRAAVAVFVLWALVTFVGVVALSRSGGVVSRFQQQVILYSLSVITAVLGFALFRVSRSLADGTALGWRISIVGPIAAALGVYGTLWKTMPIQTHRTVQVYLAPRGENAAEKVTSFVIHYRRPNGAASVAGRDNVAVVQDVPWEAKELVVDRIECVGYIALHQQENAARPWKYPIQFSGESGEVTIEMVRWKTPEDPMPTSTQVRAMIKKHGLTEAEIRQPAGIDKRHVSLTIVNATDRPIDFVACDCLVAFDEEADVMGATLWTVWKDIRHIQPDGVKRWPNFENYRSSSGWFALFVRYEEPEHSRTIQKPLGVYSLFKIREPRVVIERKAGASGVEFRLSEERSRLGER